MSAIYADFNAMTEGGHVCLSCAASQRGLLAAGGLAGRTVLLTDGEIEVDAVLAVDHKYGLVGVPRSGFRDCPAVPAPPARLFDDDEVIGPDASINGYPLDALFSECWVVAKASPDPSTQNGAVIATRPGWLLRGCNTLTRGMAATPERLERPLKYAVIEHAERNAVYGAAFAGTRCRDATMVALWAACSDCARAIVQSGIVRLVRHGWFLDHSPARWVESIAQGDEILAAGGVEVVRHDGPIETGGLSLRFCGEDMNPWC